MTVISVCHCTNKKFKKDLKIKLEYHEDQESDVTFTVNHEVEGEDLAAVKYNLHKLSVKIRSSLMAPPIQATPQTEPNVDSNPRNGHDLLLDRRGRLFCPLMLECDLCGTIQHVKSFLTFTET